MTILLRFLFQLGRSMCTLQRDTWNWLGWIGLKPTTPIGGRTPRYSPPQTNRGQTPKHHEHHRPRFGYGLRTCEEPTPTPYMDAWALAGKRFKLPEEDDEGGDSDSEHDEGLLG